MSTTTTAPKRKIQLLIWLLVVMTAVGSVWASGAASAAPKTSDVSVGLANPPIELASGTSPFVAAQKQFIGPIQTITIPGNKGAVSADAYYTKNPHMLLPAYRWSGNPALREDVDGGSITNLGPFVQRMQATVASICFSVAQIPWTWSLSIIRGALGFDAFRGAAFQVNNAALSLSGGLGSSGIVFLVLIFAGFIAGQALIRGRVAKAGRILVATIIPLALITLMGSTTLKQHQATEGLDEDARNAAALSNPATPAGLADFTLDSIGSLTNQVFQLSLTNSTPAGDLNSTRRPSCIASATQPGYETELYSLADGYHSGRVGPYSDASWAAIKTFGGVWEASYLQFYQKALASDTPYGWRVRCQQLEQANGIGPQERYFIMGRVAPLPAWAGPWEITFTEGTDDKPGNPKVFKNDGSFPPAPYSTALPEEFKGRAILPFAACRLEGSGYVIVEEWQGVNNIDENSDACQNFFNEGALGTCDEPCDAADGDPFSFSSSNDIASQAAGASSPDVATFIRAYHGYNSGERLSNGLFALIVGVIYAFVLIPLGIGLFIAQFGFFIMLVILPVTLLMLALPNNQIGMRMLRMTGGFGLSTTIIGVAMALLVWITAQGQALISTFDGSLAALAAGFMPLVALLVLKKIAKSVGISNLGVGLAAAGGLAAVKAPQNMVGAFSGAKISTMASGAKKSLDKGLGKYDQAARNVKKLPVVGQPLNRLAPRVGEKALMVKNAKDAESRIKSSEQLIAAGKIDNNGMFIPRKNRRGRLNTLAKGQKSDEMSSLVSQAAIATRAGLRPADAAFGSGLADGITEQVALDARAAKPIAFVSALSATTTAQNALLRNSLANPATGERVSEHVEALQSGIISTRQALYNTSARPAVSMEQRELEVFEGARSLGVAEGQVFANNVGLPVMPIFGMHGELPTIVDYNIAASNPTMSLPPEIRAEIGSLARSNPDQAAIFACKMLEAHGDGWMDWESGQLRQLDASQITADALNNLKGGNSDALSERAYLGGANNVMLQDSRAAVAAVSANMEAARAQAADASRSMVAVAVERLRVSSNTDAQLERHARQLAADPTIEQYDKTLVSLASWIDARQTRILSQIDAAIVAAGQGYGVAGNASAAHNALANLDEIRDAAKAAADKARASLANAKTATDLYNVAQLKTDGSLARIFNDAFSEKQLKDIVNAAIADLTRATSSTSMTKARSYRSSVTKK